jgi:hypothetical protein
MALAEHPNVGIVRKDSQATTLVAAAGAAAALPPTCPHQKGLGDVEVEVEACGSDTVTAVPELSITERGQFSTSLLRLR